MHALLAPVLAQVITLGLADRLEARYVASATQRQPDGTTSIPAVRQFDGINTTTPAARVQFDLRRASISLGYAPTLTLVPLIEAPREFLVYHRASLTADYRWKRTTVALGEVVGYGERDFALESLMPRTTAGTTPQPNQAAPNAQRDPNTPNAPNANPPPAGGTTGTTGTQGGAAPGGTTPGGVRPYAPGTGKINFSEFRSFLTLNHAFSRPLTLRVQGGYSISGGTTEQDRKSYPRTRGPDATLALRYEADPRNALVTTLTGVYTKSDTELHNRAYYTTLTEDYLHRFSRLTSGIVGAGLSFGRTQQDLGLGLPLYSVYPVLRAGLAHSSRVAQGMLTVTADVNTAPAMDLNTATVDPRIGTILSAMWTRERFSFIANASSTISIQRKESHTFDSILTTATARYDLGAGFGADLGARTTFQRYNGQDTIPQTWVMFLGVTYVFLQPFNEPRPRKAAVAAGGVAAPGKGDEKGDPAGGAPAGGGKGGATGKGGGAAAGGGAK